MSNVCGTSMNVWHVTCPIAKLICFWKSIYLNELSSK